mmetsp:Transcript_115753/g.374034  ORF Transcript_115753/g.374034 Transcript_115753/m.374034 type:complete len:203 (-) Transcript_115753:621-1229(-)
MPALVWCWIARRATAAPTAGQAPAASRERPPCVKATERSVAMMAAALWKGMKFTLLQVSCAQASAHMQMYEHRAVKLLPMANCRMPAAVTKPVPDMSTTVAAVMRRGKSTGSSSASAARAGQASHCLEVPQGSASLSTSAAAWDTKPPMRRRRRRATTKETAATASAGRLAASSEKPQPPVKPRTEMAAAQVAVPRAVGSRP